MSSYSALLDVSGLPLAGMVRRDDGAIVLTFSHDDNADTDAFLAWLAAGNAVGPASSLSLPTVTGNQWAFALSTMSLSAAWQVGVNKSKASDQVRVGLIARDTPLLVADPLLARVAANAGQDGSGNPLIVVASVFATAQSMPT